MAGRLAEVTDSGKELRDQLSGAEAAAKLRRLAMRQEEDSAEGLVESRSWPGFQLH